MAATRESVRRTIPLATPDIGERELELVTQVLRSDVLAMGSFTERFEAGVAELAGRREGVACSSGTAGLHLGVRALGIVEGDEVLTTPFSFVASANCLLYERAVPRFVDIEEDSLGMDPDLLAAATSTRTRAVLPVGLATLGVPSRPYFAPIHLQPFYRSMFGFKPGDFPVTERVAASTLALPFSSRLSDDDVGHVAEVLIDAIDRPGRLGG
jgi:dTDP-4-amino-4,6-dideoxygalactose transaminase